MNIASLPILITILLISFTGFMCVLFFTGTKNKKQARVRSIIMTRSDSTVTSSDDEDDALQGKDKGGKHSVTKKLKSVQGRAEAQKNKKSLTSLIGQAGFETSLLKFWIYSVVFGTLCAVPIWFSGLSGFVKTMLIFTVYFGLPRFFLKWRANKRQKLFLQDFANALEDKIRLLQAGMPISEAISMVAKEYSGPVGEEMQRIYNAQRLGTPLPEAVQQMTIRLPIPEVQMFATTIAIQVQTGSSLSEVLGNLAGVIRGRYSLKRKVTALSSEAKISALIIGSIPFVLTGILYLVNREYVMLLFTHPTGKMLTTGALIWMGIGVLVMRQMINFKV